MAVKAIIFFIGLIFSYYALRRVWRDVRDGDVIDDSAAFGTSAMWTIFYLLNH